MNKKLVFLLLNICFVQLGFAQTDSIFIRFSLDEKSQIVHVTQKLIYRNTSNQNITEFGFNAWANAYSGRLTSLNERKLENRNKNLYFADKSEKGGIRNLSISIENTACSFNEKEREFIELSLPKPIFPNQTQLFELTYDVKLPKDFITKLGYSNNGYLLQYFFLQPTLFADGKPVFEHFLDENNITTNPTYYEIEFVNNSSYTIESNLQKQENKLYGTTIEPPIIEIATKTYEITQVQQTKVVYSDAFSEEQKPYVAKSLERQLTFLTHYFDQFPAKIFIHSKLQKAQNFVGIESIKVLPNWQIELFTQEEQVDIQLFQYVATEMMNQYFETDKNKNHWIINGLATYLQIEYLQQYYPNHKLIGNLGEKIHIGKVKPLNWFFLSDVKLIDRYKLFYVYILRQNYDQAITTDYLEFSNINQSIISYFKSGIIFHYVDEYVGQDDFRPLLKQYLTENRLKRIDYESFTSFFCKNSTKDLCSFQSLISSESKVNFGIKAFQTEKDSIQLKIKNDYKTPIPFKVVAMKKDSVVAEKWFQTREKFTWINFPKGDYDKFVVNPNYLYPEYNDRDNYLNTKGLFKNGKKLQLKLYADMENPEYNQVFFSPKFKWNDYDKLIIGMKFNNNSPLMREFRYSIVPSYSTGTNSLTGQASFKYLITPEKGIFRNINLAAGISNYHYDKELTYEKYGLSASFNFHKQPRSEIGRAVSISYDYVNKEISPTLLPELFDFNRYNLLELGYYYSDTKLIHEKSGLVHYQYSDAFQKVYAEGFYRYEYAKNKKLSTRLFAGIFLHNNIENTNYFDFGISRITDYAFNYNMLGRSAKEGLLYQEYTQAEGGMKSFYDVNSVNQWLVSLNTEMHLWKMFDIYAGTTLYKNKSIQPEFLYETGVRLRVIPDFVEFYFPVQTSNGFEIGKDDYLKRIRFTFSMDIHKVVSVLKRGWF